MATLNLVLDKRRVKKNGTYPVVLIETHTAILGGHGIMKCTTNDQIVVCFWTMPIIAREIPIYNMFWCRPTFPNMTHRGFNY